MLALFLAIFLAILSGHLYNKQVRIWLMLKKLNLLPALPPVLSGLGQLPHHEIGDPRLLSKPYRLPASLAS